MSSWRIFMEFSLHRHDWVHHWPLWLIKLLVSFLSLEVKGKAWKFQPSTLMLGSPGHQHPSESLQESIKSPSISLAYRRALSFRDSRGFSSFVPGGKGRSVCVRAKSLQLCPTLCGPMDGHTSLLCPWDSLGKKTGLSELLCPPPGDLPNPGIEPTHLMFPALVGGFFTLSATWEAQGKEGRDQTCSSYYATGAV